MEGTKVVMGGSPQSPPLGKNLFHLNVLAGQEHFVLTAQFNNTVSAYSKCISQRKPFKISKPFLMLVVEDQSIQP